MASKLIVNEIEHTFGSGTAVTMAKATIADATLTAGTLGSGVTIPAAGVTGVLPVGVTGGSGLTALASNPTVTLGSNATFPAGMIIQTAYNEHNGSASYATTTSTTLARVRDNGDSEYYWKCPITGVKASSHIYIMTTFVGRFYRPHTEAAGAFGLLRDDDGGGTNLETLYTTHSNQYHMQINASGQSYWMFQAIWTITYKHTSPATGNNTYYLGFKSADGISQVSVESASNQSEEPFRMTLMEIAQ